MSRNLSIAAVVTVLLISTMLVPLMSLTTTAVHSGADSQPPASGNWYVNTPNNQVAGETLTVNGSLIINKTSSLRLENSTVKMNKTGSYITVLGNLTLVNSTITTGPGATGFNVAFNGKSNISLSKSTLAGANSLFVNTTGALAVAGSSVVDVDLFRINAPISIFNSTFEDVNVSMNATVKVYNCTSLGNFGMDFTPNGSAVVYNYINILARNETGIDVTGATVTVKDYFGALIGSASTNGAGTAKNVAVKTEFINATQYLPLYEGLVNVTVVKGPFAETVWTRGYPGIWIVVDTSDKSPIAILQPVGGSATYVPVQFNASRSFDLEGPLSSYSWDFGDGATAQTASPLCAHTYQWPGNYRAALKVTDGASHTDTTYIDVHVDWIVASQVEVSNRIMEMNADVQVLAGGSLTLKNVTLAFNCSYDDEYRFVVHTGGAVSILDSDSDPATAAGSSRILSGRLSLGTLIPTSGHAQIVIENGTQALLSNSRFSDLGWDTGSGAGIVLGSDGALLTGCTFEDSTAGVAVAPFDNNMVAIDVQGCTFKDNVVGLALRQNTGPAELDIAGCQFVDNTNFALDLPSGLGIIQASLVDCEISGSNTGLYGEGIGVFELSATTLHHNSLGLELHGIVGDIYAVLDSVTVHSGAVGLTMDHTKMTARNCTVYNQSNWDLALDDLSITTLLNCSFSKPKVTFLDPTAQMMVYNYLSVEGRWPNGKVVPGTFINITNSTGASAFAGTTGAKGRVECLPVQHYMMNSTSTQYADTVLDVNVSIYGLYHNKTTSNVNATKVLSLTLTDTDKPTGGVVINNGTAVSDSYLVGLALHYSDVGSGVESIALSNNPFNASNTFWEAPAPTKLWVLQPLNGLQTVYMMVRDASGAVSGEYQDTITVDTVLPHSAVKGMDPYQKTGTFTLSWEAIGEPLLGIESFTIQYSSDGAFWQDWLFDVNITTAQWAGSQEGDTVYFRCLAKDLAGNQEIKTGYDVKVMVDSVAPQSALAPTALYHTGLGIGLSWTGYDRTSHVSSYIIQYTTSLAPAQWTTLSAGLTGLSGVFDMPGDGTYYLRVLGTDNAGNAETKSGDVNDVQVIIDTTLPTVSSLGADAQDFTAEVSWTTSEPTRATLYYGDDVDALRAIKDMVASTFHSVTIAQLEQNTQYYYKIVITDIAGNTIVEDDSGNMNTFTTKARFGTIEGIVADQATSAPVKQAAVYVNGVFRALTNATGGFKIYLPQGNYDLMVSHMDYLTFTAPEDVEVLAGRATPKSILLVLKPKISGTLNVYANADGTPLVGASIVVRSGTETVLMGSTDSQGRFSAVLKPGAYTVLVTMPGYGAETQAAEVSNGTQVTATLVLEELPEQKSPFIKQNDLILIILASVIGLIVLLFIGYLVYTKFAPIRKAPAKKAEEHKDEPKKDADKAKEGKDEDAQEEEGEVECPSCGAVVSVKNARCPECGESLYEVISGDGDVVEEEVAFECPFCGHEMELEAAKCPECDQEVPQHYKDEFKQAAADSEATKSKKPSKETKKAVPGDKGGKGQDKAESGEEAGEDEEALDDGAGEDEQAVEVSEGGKEQ